MITALLTGLSCAIFLFALALAMVVSPPPAQLPPANVFGFPKRTQPQPEEGPPLQRYTARDGAALAYRFFPSQAKPILVFAHGSSYHGGAYRALAAALASANIANVALPNLRGHYMSGARRGDVDYIGQYEDDLADLIGTLRTEGHTGPVIMGGHSSGGGLALRFAGGKHAQLVKNYLLLAPILPVSPAIRKGNAGGWSNVHLKRVLGLLMLDAIGVHGFDALPVISFNKPAEFWDGTETLSYSHRLNQSYHPRLRFQGDLKALPAGAQMLIGANDQAIDPDILRGLFATDAPATQVTILPDTDHFGIFRDAAAQEAVVQAVKTMTD